MLTRIHIRPAILIVIAAMLALSLLASVSARYGHADSPIAATAEEIRPLTAGQSAPRFMVRTVDGASFDFDPRELERPTMLIVFRGGWCPYCNMHLSELRHIVPDIHELGIDILFLSGDRPAALYDGLGADTQEDIEGRSYRILSDADSNAAIALGIAFTVDPAYVQRLRDRDKDLLDSSIERQGVLPVPAVFAIDAEGTIAFAYTNADYKVRLPTEELLAVAETLAAD